MNTTKLKLARKLWCVEFVPPHVQRHNIRAWVRSVSMGVSGEDLLLSPAARRKLPISVECKSRASISVYGHYQQAKDNCRGFEPVLVIKQNRDKPLVVVDCEYFFELLRKVSNDNL